VAALQKLLNGSEFIKGALVDLSRLSPNFLAYSLSVSKGQLALLPLLFTTLENQKCLEDTLKVPDYHHKNSRHYASLPPTRRPGCRRNQPLPFLATFLPGSVPDAAQWQGREKDIFKLQEHSQSAQEVTPLSRHPREERDL